MITITLKYHLPSVKVNLLFPLQRKEFNVMLLLTTQNLAPLGAEKLYMVYRCVQKSDQISVSPFTNASLTFNFQSLFIKRTYKVKRLLTFTSAAL